MSNLPNNIKLNSSTVLANESAFGSTLVSKFRIVTGSRLVFSLVITSIDVGATLTVNLKNGFSVDVTKEILQTFSETAVGNYKKIVTDFHSLFDAEISISGGFADFYLAVTAHDNALDSSGSGGGSDPIKVDDLLEGIGIGTTITVGTTPIEAKVGATAMTNRKGILVQSNTGKIYYGFSSLMTLSDGLVIYKGPANFFPNKSTAPIYIVSPVAGAQVTIWEVT